ncbi:hypothetical protein VSX64_20310 [Aurantimonas sp. C2-6-R+9]|uniref:hypothetical protein n=1 Tax=unclassified Aurantimonas TaxID=2638230 RepID=UPI002E18E077|nr:MULTISPECIES: hypothetical protein [unclassified Aurantimonas]MEC5383172.1 hypothetical protein [Aurantimonas sp. C2-6-R+9]MEC5414065.1 hypothetical protein [Aurantimonas sp. C2-4-R8]
MRKVFVLSMMSIMMMASNAGGDIVKIETNDWSDRRDLVWTGTLEQIDQESGIAYFSYRNKEEIVKFSVHISRIYSLTIDTQDRVNREFPPTRADLETELSVNPNSKRRIILSNDNTYTALNIPKAVIVTPNRESAEIGIRGTIKRADLEKILVIARSVDRSEEEFDVDRGDLMQWIR